MLTTNVLLAPTALAVHQLLLIYDDYAKEYRASFNANVSKCMYTSVDTLAHISHWGHSVDYLNEWSH